ncbi:MAG: glycoside hydrolase family 2, partial [Oscillospiraceae bacterium]|nr:glycoside hydrolase family 2 [Oscillospiraceae bacterium]
GWGYGSSVSSEEEFLERFSSLIKAVEAMDISGYCYTQLTDVEQETNGLLTAERVPKVSVEKIRKIVSG